MAEENRAWGYRRIHVWYVQPYAATPYTTIRSDGAWSNQTHLGTEYAALLVSPDFKPPASSPDLPEQAEGVVAHIDVQGRR